MYLTYKTVIELFDKLVSFSYTISPFSFNFFKKRFLSKFDSPNNADIP